MHRGLVIMVIAVVVAIAVSAKHEKKIFFRLRLPRIVIPLPYPYLGSKRAFESRSGSEENWAEGFKLLDRNGDGFVDTKEITYDINNFFPGQANRSPADIISEADKDGDGKISFEDFLATVQSGPSYEEEI